MAFDIYKQAKEVNADYYDPHTGITYCIQDYNAGKTPLGIYAQRDGKTIGFVPLPADKSIEGVADS